MAAVARPHGVQGELRLKIFNEGSQLLTSRPRIKLALADGTQRDAKLTSAREVPGGLLVRLEGVSDRNAAELLREAQILVRRADFPPLEDGELYACDLEGARAELTTGETVGTVKGLQNYPTCDVLLVAREGKPILEIPLVDAYVDRVDTAAGLVVLKTLDDLE